MANEIPKGEFAELNLSDILLDDNIRQVAAEITGEDMNLVMSVRELGVLEPVIIRKDKAGKHHLRAGYRRYAAAKEVGLEVIPTMIYTVDELQGLEMALVENLQREDMNPIDRADALKQLVDKAGVPQKEVAARLGISEGYISQHWALLELPSSVQKAIRSGAMPYTCGREFARLKEAPKLQQAAFVEWEEKELTPKKLSVLVKDMLTAEDARKAAEPVKAEEKTKTPRKAKKDEEEEAVVTLVDQMRNAKIKVKSETGLRKLLMEWAEKVETSRKPETRRERELVLEGIRMAAGVELE